MNLQVDKKFKDFLWPDVSTNVGSHYAIKIGYTSAAIVSIVSGIFAFISQKPFIESSMIDAIIFAIIAIGILKKSRVAALIGLLLFFGEKIYDIAFLNTRINYLSFLLLLCFYNGVRGTFAWHKFKKSVVPSKND